MGRDELPPFNLCHLSLADQKRLLPVIRAFRKLSKPSGGASLGMGLGIISPCAAGAQPTPLLALAPLLADSIRPKGVRNERRQLK